MPKYELTIVEHEADRVAYHQIRRAVLFGGRTDYIENGPEESKTQNLSLLLKVRGLPLGTVRLDTKAGGKAIVRLLAIAAEVQHRGHGTELMGMVETLARDMGVSELLVHAYPIAVGFYEKIGYVQAAFEEADGPGVQMRKLLPER